MKTAVIYKSKSGFAKKYAYWIAEDLNADLYAAERVSVKALQAYDAVIFGGGLYATGINGLKQLKRNLDAFDGKKLAVYATGATPYRPETVAELLQSNFSPAEQEKIRFFYLRGGFDYSKLGTRDKILMKLLKAKLKRKKVKSADERGMLAAYDKPMDFTRRKNIDPLIRYIRDGEKEVRS